MMMAVSASAHGWFDQDSGKHSFVQCELVRILSTTITRSNSEFAKLSFDGVYDPRTYIGDCYNSLWQEWCDNKILSNDVLQDTAQWDEWMIDYYNNCKQDYFNTMAEMFCLMQFHTQSMNGDYSWAFKHDNLSIIQNHNGLVTTKLVNKLEYLLKKHNFGSLNLKQKQQKYRTRKRGGCKKCNQIRDIKKMLENYVNLRPKQLSNESTKSNGSKHGAMAKYQEKEIVAMPMTFTYTSQDNGARAMGWKTTEIISNPDNLHCDTNRKSASQDKYLSYSIMSAVSGDSHMTARSVHSVHSVHSGDECSSSDGSHSGSRQSHGAGSKSPALSLVNCDDSFDSSSNGGPSMNLNCHASDTTSTSGASDLDSESCKSPALASLTIAGDAPPLAPTLDITHMGPGPTGEEIDAALQLTPTPPPPMLPAMTVGNVEDILASVMGDVEFESKEAEEARFASSLHATAREENDTSFNTAYASNVAFGWYDINKLFPSNGKEVRVNEEQTEEAEELVMPDPNVKEWQFDALDMICCQYGQILEFYKPTVLCDNDFGCYLYYIPREYLCNIKIVRQFKLAIENLANWAENKTGDASHDKAWYTHNDSTLDFGYECGNGARHGLVGRNACPEWLMGTEKKVVDLLAKFPQLNAIVRNNVPNSCLMRQLDNGSKQSELDNVNSKYVNTLSSTDGSINLFLGATRTLAIGSMVRNHVFGINVRFGDVCVMAGKFERCYKSGMPMQTGINESTLHLAFRKVDLVQT